MRYTLTAIAAYPLTPETSVALEKALLQCLESHRLTPLKTVWSSAGKALDMALGNPPDARQMAHLRAVANPYKTDVLVTQAATRRKKLLLADMDSTIVVGETLDDLAAHVGVGEQVAAITARAMNDELDFAQALAERLALLKDLPVEVIQQVVSQTKLMPGALTLVKTMKAHGAYCVLISGGFTVFTQVVADQCGFDRHVGNRLDISQGQLTGQLVLPIVDKYTKLAELNQNLTALSLTPDDALTVGDGANDMPMLAAAGLGVGYHPKQVVLDATDNIIIYGDLTALLYAQGYLEADWVN